MTFGVLSPILTLVLSLIESLCAPEPFFSSILQPTHCLILLGCSYMYAYEHSPALSALVSAGLHTCMLQQLAQQTSPLAQSSSLVHAGSTQAASTQNHSAC